MVILRTGYPDIFESRLANLHTIIMQIYEQFPSVANLIFREETSNRTFEKTTGVSDIGLAVETDEGEDGHIDEPVQMFDKTFTHVKSTLGVEISKEAQDDDVDRIFAERADMLAASIFETQEITLMNHFNNGWSTSYTGPDAKELFARDHPGAKSGENIANEPATPADLGVTSFQQALVDWRDTKTDAGNRINLGRIQYLLVPTENLFMAIQLCENPQQPDTANRNINALRRVMPGVVPIASEYLTDSDAFFLVAEKSNHRLIRFIRERLETNDEYSVRRGVLMVLSEYRESSGWADFRGLWASPGA